MNSINSPNKEQLERRIREKIIYYLSRRDHSEKELRQKLQRFEYPTDLVLNAIEWAKERKYLCEPERMSERHVERLQKKKKGRNYIQNYLQQKGLPTSKIDIDEELSNARELAHSLAQKILKNKANKIDLINTKMRHIDDPSSKIEESCATPIKSKRKFESKSESKSKFKFKSQTTENNPQELDRNDREKIGRKLLSRGFSLDIVRKVIYEKF